MSRTADDRVTPTLEDVDVDLLDYLQSLTPAQRMERHEAALELVRALRKASREHYGFDPRAVATAVDREG
ncbi:MAG: hypothetical protein AMXMBFR34_47620 [Myxococcaceae bacterium]